MSNLEKDAAGERMVVRDLKLYALMRCFDCRNTELHDYIMLDTVDLKPFLQPTEPATTCTSFQPETPQTDSGFHRPGQVNQEVVWLFPSIQLKETATLSAV